MDLDIQDIIIAIDGYSSTGKSSFAKLIAKELGFLYLDSGALYRGVTLLVLENGWYNGDHIDTDKLVPALNALDLHFEDHGKGVRTYMGARCIERQIRSMKVSALVSPVAAIPEVRRYVDRRLHELARNRRVVMDGRDIGTTVFPDAELKIFMTADKKVRAQRRMDELIAKGEPVEFQEILDNLEQRDYIDSHRVASPLRQASDAIVLDNTNMTFEQQMDWLEGILKERFAR